MNRLISARSYRFRSFPFRRLSHPLSAHGRHIADNQLNPLYILWHYHILDPGSEIVSIWNHIFLVTCMIALFIDPLYFFIPGVRGPACLDADRSSAVLITFFRSFADLFFMLHMLMKFRTAFVAPSSRVFGRGELVMDAREIAKRYLKSTFVVDLAATLPCPRTATTFCIVFSAQIIIWLLISRPTDPKTSSSNNTLALIVLIQYVPRLFVMIPLNRRIVKTTGVVAKTAWSGAAYNLLLYMLASHVLGASWYLLSLGRQHTCWREECNRELDVCSLSFLDCRSVNEPERQNWMNVTQVIFKCDPNNEDIDFKFGMFADAFTNNVASAPFTEKYFYCLWWGLRNLSSYGQNLATTIYVGETLFCILICIAGLTLFTQLIGNMQSYLQSMTVRLEEWRVKRRDTEEWMRHRQLPPELQERVRRFVQYKWLATRGVDEETILQSLPLDLRRQIQRHLCLKLVRRVPFFSQMDAQLLDAICERLVSSLSTQDTYIVREDDPVNEMLFIIRGQLESSTTNGGRSGFFNSITLRPGDFCGEELLTWALMSNAGLNLPSSTRTVRALSEVEAFALRAEDLKFVANQFRRLHSKKLQHAFRYYSHQWRTWGSCIIQAAWRRHRKRQLAKDLFMQESLDYASLEEALELEEGSYGNEIGERSSGTIPSGVQHLGATILASKFAANTRRGATQKVVHIPDTASASLKMPKLFKPEEPDFSMDSHDGSSLI